MCDTVLARSNANGARSNVRHIHRGVGKAVSVHSANVFICKNSSGEGQRRSIDIDR